MTSTIKAAQMPGWASLAVGATEIVATRWLEEQLGVDEHHALIRSFGAREIVAGVTILSQPGLNRTLACGLWGRVAGDVLDLATLSLAARSTRNKSGWASITALVLAITGLDVVVASGAQYNLFHAARVAKRARLRVRPTQATPGGKHPAETTNQPEVALPVMS